MAGAFCGLVLMGVIAGPVVVGAVLGVALRASLKSSNFSHRSYLPVLLAALMPIVWAAIEGPPRPIGAIESVSTSERIDATARDVFDALVFHEQVSTPPPLLVEWLLPEPVRTEGVIIAPGDTTVCVYTSGTLTKRATHVEGGRLLAFDVVEQSIGLEREVTLTGGRFVLEPLADGATRLTLMTEFRPRLTPRLAWRWGEAMAVHALHAHVIDAIRERAEGDAHLAATDGAR
jgi:hypothetical protein